MEDEALRLYPDLTPIGRGRASATAAELPSEPETTPETAPAPGLTPEEIAYGQDYTKGFALGYVEAYAKAFGTARDEAYQAAYQEGYAKGHAEYKRLHAHGDGQPYAPQEEIDLAKKALLLGRYEEAINRLDIAIATEGANPVLDEALYQKAAVYYHWDKMDRALETARKLVVQLPESGFCDDAYFLVGAASECLKTGGFLGLLTTRHYKEALEAYQTLLNQYPGSKLVAETLYRMGSCHEATRDKKS
ncbi:MAG: tetratricopeptide repeat protein, partial [Candidatus Riflebacteria bacterium]|nr:tetratricopeptide repeat protein [Candidatus Riflebacteria bacterium]